MIKCNNNCGESTTPVNPCQQDPCANVNKDEVIIKLYIDECCRKIYPVTSSDAVIAKTGTSLTESLNNFESRINTILATIRSIEANSNDYSAEINNLARQLTTVSANVSVLINGGSTDDIGARIDAIEVLIAKINELLMLLLEATGKAGCDPIEVKTYDNVYVTHSGTIYYNTANWAHIKVYKVVPESIIKVIFENENTRTVNDPATFSLISFATTSEFNAGDTVIVPDISGNKINFKDIDTGRIEFNNVPVPNDKLYLLISYGDLSRNEQIRKMIPSVTAVQCPEEDDDSSSSEGSNDENVLENVKYPNGSNLTIDTTDKSVTLPDVIVNGNSSFNVNTKRFEIATVLPIHGYLSPDENYNRYPNGYYLSLGSTEFTPLSNASAYKKAGFLDYNNGHKMFNSTFLWPEKGYVHSCLLRLDETFTESTLAKIFKQDVYDLNARENDFTNSTKYGDSDIEVSKYKGQIVKNASTTNKAILIYKVTKGYSYKIKINDNEGDGVDYSIFGESVLSNPDEITPLIVHSSNYKNWEVSEFIVNIPDDYVAESGSTLTETQVAYNNENTVYLAVGYHMLGLLNVYKMLLSDPDNHTKKESEWLNDETENADSYIGADLYAIFYDGDSFDSTKAILILPYTMFYELDTNRFVYRRNKFLTIC